METSTTSLPRNRYRAVFLSDTHLGTRAARASELAAFLDVTDTEYLYLVGDLIDIWALKKTWYWDAAHDQVIRHVLGKGRHGTRVTYVPGNHDEALRDWTPDHDRSGVLGISGIALASSAEHVMLDGRRLLVVHGDEFDTVIRFAPWVGHLGDAAYEVALLLNRWLNAARRRMGFPYWSLAAYLKGKVKLATVVMGRFEEALTRHARDRGMDGVVCGHIHVPAFRVTPSGTLYLNDGDWVESRSALVEHLDGALELLVFGEAGYPIASLGRSEARAPVASAQTTNAG